MEWWNIIAGVKGEPLRLPTPVESPRKEEAFGLDLIWLKGHSLGKLLEFDETGKLCSKFFSFSFSIDFLLPVTVSGAHYEGY